MHALQGDVQVGESSGLLVVLLLTFELVVKVVSVHVIHGQLFLSAAEDTLSDEMLLPGHDKAASPAFLFISEHRAIYIEIAQILIELARRHTFVTRCMLHLVVEAEPSHRLNSVLCLLLVQVENLVGDQGVSEPADITFQDRAFSGNSCF